MNRFCNSFVIINIFNSNFTIFSYGNFIYKELIGFWSGCFILEWSTVDFGGGRCQKSKLCETIFFSIKITYNGHKTRHIRLDLIRVIFDFLMTSKFTITQKGLKGVCYTKSGGSEIVHICVAGKSTLVQHLSESTQCHLSPGCGYGGVRNIWRSAGPRQVYTLLPRWWHSAD